MRSIRYTKCQTRTEDRACRITKLPFRPSFPLTGGGGFGCTRGICKCTIDTNAKRVADPLPDRHRPRRWATLLLTGFSVWIAWRTVRDVAKKYPQDRLKRIPIQKLEILAMRAGRAWAMA